LLSNRSNRAGRKKRVPRLQLRSINLAAAD
jgi:hypothetical protein